MNPGPPGKEHPLYHLCYLAIVVLFPFVSEEGGDASSSVEEFKHLNGHDVIAEETLSNETIVEEPSIKVITPSNEITAEVASNDVIAEEASNDVIAEANLTTNDVTTPSIDKVDTAEPRQTDLEAVPEQVENIPE